MSKGQGKCGVLLAALTLTAVCRAADVSVDLSAYTPTSGVDVKRQEDRLVIGWPMGEKEFGRLVLDLRPEQPLIEILGIAGGAAEAAKPLLRGMEPLAFLTVGTRQAPPG